MNRLFYSTLILALLISCAPTVAKTPLVATVAPDIHPASPLPTSLPRIWWQDAVFYEVFVRSFMDSNGDGIGDFNGLTSKLDYLKSLGITALWLMPIHPSPSYHGYDVLNYYAVNSQYGSLDDFKHLVDEAHTRNIRIIIDLVLNHTSIQHPWFIAANSDEKSSYRNWYIWSDTSPSNKWVQGKSNNYYAYFGDGMPDLNYQNPEVTLQMEKMSSFWLKTIGVDGFRVDAAKHLIEEGSKLENTASTHTWLRDFYTFYKTENPDAYVVGEVGGAGGLIAKTYSGQMDQIFNFELASAIVNSAMGGANSSVNSAYKFILHDKPDGNFATFLTNHDQNRVMSTLNGQTNKAKVAASLLLTAPGTPFIYYGEELGMQGKKPDENIRLPMQWTNDLATAGFTSGQPWREPGNNTATINVNDQEKDPTSLLNHYRTLISIRKKFHSLQTGSLTLLETGNPGVFAILRKEGQETVLVLINLSAQTAGDYQLILANPLLQDGSYLPEIIYGDGKISPLLVSKGKFSAYRPLPELLPYSTTLILIK